MKTIFALFVCFSGNFTYLFSQSVANFYPEELIVTASALNLRESPDAASKKVIALPRGTVMQFIEANNNGEYVVVDSISGNWYKVQALGKTGYVFSAYVTASIGLYYEGDFLENLPPMQWYGVYARDSFSDEIRKINVRLVAENNEMYGPVKTLKTNQKEQSKFLIGTNTTMPLGYAGPLGSVDINSMFVSLAMQPGNQLAIYAGNETGDTLIKPTYGMVSTGCATLEGTYVHISNYQLTLVDYTKDPPGYQDLTKWVKQEDPEENNPMVDLLWFGDLDHDNKPDAIIQDCPYPEGCRASLFLSSKAKRGEYLHKVSEHYWPGD